MFLIMDKHDVFTAILRCGGGSSSSGGGGGGRIQSHSGNNAISQKMDRDNSANRTAYNNARGTGWSTFQTRSHAAAMANGAANGWPTSPRLGGCTGCHQGRYDW